MPCVMWVFSKKAAPSPFGGDQLIELLDLVAELDGKRIRLELAGVADGLHGLTPVFPYPSVLPRHQIRFTSCLHHRIRYAS